VGAGGCSAVVAVSATIPRTELTFQVAIFMTSLAELHRFRLPSYQRSALPA
jgi:hypothetical protein